jgi:DNA-binding NarL/FixJ family response regulator
MLDAGAKKAVRIALVDDQALVLKGLSALLNGLDAIEVALEASDGEQLIAALPQRPVDVIVSDIRMPGLSGIDMLLRLRETGNATPVILLTTFDDSELMLAAVDAGAQGFLLKDASPEDLADAIRRVAAGDTLLQPVSIGPVRSLRRPEPHIGPRLHLTEREASILRLVAGGYSNKEIGRSLHLSEGTVKNYMSDILVKLDCRDRTHAVLKAITQRLL